MSKVNLIQSIIKKKKIQENWESINLTSKNPLIRLWSSKRRDFSITEIFPKKVTKDKSWNIVLFISMSKVNLIQSIIKKKKIQEN